MSTHTFFCAIENRRYRAQCSCGWLSSISAESEEQARWYWIHNHHKKLLWRD